MTVVAGELEKLGFEEPEPGLVQDTPENRKKIYALEDGKGWQFERVLDEDGLPTGLLRPLPPATLLARREENAKIYAPLLTDPENAWSDYVGPDDWPMDAYAPFWVLDRLSAWRRKEREGALPEDQRPFPIRCTHIRSDGTRCWMWVSKPQDVDVCTPHLRARSQDMSKAVQAAKIKMMELTPAMVDRLEWYAYNADGEAVGLKAVTEILDRGGARAGVDVDINAYVEISNPADAVQEKLNSLAERLEAAARKEAEARAHLEAEAAAERAAITVKGEVINDEPS